MSQYKERRSRIAPLDDQADFVMNFVDDSASKRSDIEEVWDEVEANFLVRPFDQMSMSGSTKYPLATSLADVYTPNLRTVASLKDPETHQEVMTIVSKLMLALFPESEFVKTRHRGFEDIHKSLLTNGLIRHVSALPGHYQTFFEWLLSAGIYGVGQIRGYWDYREEYRTIRSMEYGLEGEQSSTFTSMSVPVWDDPRFCPVEVRDFYPDTSATRISEMIGCAERFRITADEAFRRAAKGMYEQSAVIRAVERAMSLDHQEDIDKTASEIDLGHIREMNPDFVPLVGYEYVGETPFMSAKGDAGFDDGISRRVITVLAGETVRSKPWPRRLPYFDVRILPRLGSYWGISPGEIIRYDQDFADTLKMMLADAVVRATHPPLVYDKNADIDQAKLRAFRPRVPIGADFRGRMPIEQVPYNPPVGPAFEMYGGVKQQMREASAALGAVQGLGLGSKRFSASEANTTFQQALDRPEMFASIVEREYLPEVGRYIISLYQEFLPDGQEGSQEIIKRVGQPTYNPDITDILGDFDVEFVGTRVSGSKQEELAAFREIVQASANPVISQAIPWIPLIRRYFERLGASEIAAMVGNPLVMQVNMLLTQLGGPNKMQANGGGAMPTSAPIGTIPEQAAGNANVESSL